MGRLLRLSPTQQGILLMLLTAFLFSLMDATAKGLATRYHTFEVVWARYTFQTALAVLFLMPRLKPLLKTRYLGLQLIRSAFLFGATICFFFSIVLIGLAPASAIMSINPMLITFGAYLVLREPLGLRRAIGVCAGLIGALIIIRPGSAVFSPIALLPVLAAIFYAGYAVSTRFLGREESVWTSFLYTAAIGTVGASLIVPFFWHTPTWPDLGLMILLGAIGGLAQLSLIRALSLAEAGAIAPFAYIGILFATLWGMLFFGEYPDIWVVVGALVIVGSGLYVWQREHRSTADLITNETQAH